MKGVLEIRDDDEVLRFRLLFDPEKPFDVHDHRLLISLSNLYGFVYTPRLTAPYKKKERVPSPMKLHSRAV